MICRMHVYILCVCVARKCFYACTWTPNVRNTHKHSSFMDDEISMADTVGFLFGRSADFG